MKTTNTGKGMTSAQYLSHLTTEARRADLLARIEKDPKKRRQAEERVKRAGVLIAILRSMTGASVETRAEG